MCVASHKEGERGYELLVDGVDHKGYDETPPKEFGGE